MSWSSTRSSWRRKSHYGWKASAASGHYDPTVVVESSVPHGITNYATGSAYTVARPNSERAKQFFALYEAIRRMSRLPIGHEYYLEPNAAGRAEHLLSMLANNYEVGAPKIFTQDGAALVITWDVGEVKRLLTVDSDELSLMDYHKLNNFRCDHDLPFSSYEDIKGWIDGIGGESQSSSTDEDYNAA